MRYFIALCVCAVLAAGSPSALAQDGAWLGVRATGGAAINYDLETGKKSVTPTEAKVTEVTAGGPAAAAGLKVGDVILSVDDRAIADGKALSEVIREKQPGSQVRVRLKRGGSEQDLSVVLGRRPSAKAQ